MEITQTDRENAKKALKNFKVEKTEEEKFYCMCFSLLSPQTTFKSNLKVMAELRKQEFFRKDMIKATLLKILKPVRFYNNKARCLLELKHKWDDLTEMGVFNTKLDVAFHERCWKTEERRDILVEAIRGLGYKTASMFLRDLGYLDCAIIDTHILKYLNEKLPTTKKEYLRLEQLFNRKAEVMGMTPAELDVVVWMKYSNTPWEKIVY